MKTYIALFRGINVGGKNILPMKDLISILESLHCSQVKTYIQSGNAVFQIESDDSGELSKRISSEIQNHHGFEPKLMLFETDDYKKAVDNNPYDTSNGKALHFFFMEQPPGHPDMEKLKTLKAANEQYTLVDNIFYLYAPDGIGRSKLAAKVENCMGIPTTARNWNTVKKLQEMIE